MGRLVNGVLLLTFGVVFQGTFASDEQVARFDITAITSETLTIQTDNYAGGTLDSTDAYGQLRHRHHRRGFGDNA